MNMKQKDQSVAQLPEFLSELGEAGKPGALAMPEVNRRQFFKLSGIAGGGLVLGLSVTTSKQAKAADDVVTLSPYVQIKPDGRVNLFSKNPECGQGIKTGLPLIIAEELDCAWEDVDVVQADIDAKLYGAQFAGGSMSTPMNWMPMRQAGATARAMILAAAAKKLGIDQGELSTGNTKVMHAASGREWSYGEFADVAATMPVPDAKTLTLKNESDFKLLGKRYTGVDNHKIVTGQPLFGADTRKEGMVYATYTKCDQIGGVPKSFNEAHIKSMPGVIDAFIVDEFAEPKMFNTGNGAMFGGVAVVATSTWAAIKAKRELEIDWDLSKAETASWDDLVAKAYAAKDSGGEPLMVMRRGPGGGTQVPASKGDAEGAFAGAAKVISGMYEYPYVSHAQLEPQTTTAIYENGRIEIWAPSQVPQGGESGAAAVLGLPAENVVLHQTRIGGGFGRKLANDYVHETAAIAKRMEGRPVKLQWTREDDMMHDYYRPGGFHAYKGGLDAGGNLIAWADHFMTSTGNGKAPMTGADLNPAVFPMDVTANVALTQTMYQNAMPTGPMRAPSSNAFAFAFQSFMHELALASGKDHVDFLLDTLGDPRLSIPENPGSMHTGRAAGVIKAVAERAGLGKELPKGRAMGLAFYWCHSGYVAQIADLEVNANKEVKVHKLWAAADFGFIHNLSAAENQLEGGMLDGLSQAFNAKVTFKNGVIQQTNFHQYPLLRMKHAPELEAFFMPPAEFPPTGAGEPSVPPMLAAIANAIYNATGERVRKVPLSESGYKLV